MTVNLVDRWVDLKTPAINTRGLIEACDSFDISGEESISNLFAVPCIFGLSRRKLGYLTHGKGFVGCVGVVNYEAIEDKLEDALIDAVEARNHLRVLKNEPDTLIDAKAILTDDLLVSERVKVLLKALASSP